MLSAQTMAVGVATTATVTADLATYETRWVVDVPALGSAVTNTIGETRLTIPDLI